MISLGISFQMKHNVRNYFIYIFVFSTTARTRLIIHEGLTWKIRREPSQVVFLSFFKILVLMFGERFLLASVRAPFSRKDHAQFLRRDKQIWKPGSFGHSCYSEVYVWVIDGRTVNGETPSEHVLGLGTINNHRSADVQEG